MGPVNPGVRAVAAVVVGMCAGVAVVAPACSGTVHRNPPPDIQALVLQLATPQTEWGAASRLQKVGAPAAAALVAHLRPDGFRDRDHGNHSPTMRALERIGDPAVAEIERSLTPALLGSTDIEAAQYVDTAIRVLRTIGGRAAAPLLIRVAMSAQDSQSRVMAFSGVAWPAFDFEQFRPGGPWEVCLRSEAPYACPFNSETPRVAAVVRPLLENVRNHMAQESNAQVRLAAAEVLTLWGVGASRSAGEQELLTLAARPDNAQIQESAIRALGLLSVDAARDVIKGQATGSNRAVKRAAGQALVRLKDEGYVPITIDLMKPPRPWREWWALNRNSDWRTHLSRYVEQVVPQLGAAEPWVMNEWMGTLEDADDAAALPFLSAYFRHPRFNISEVGPNTSMGGGGTPPALVLLLNLASQGSAEARQLLYECSDTRDYPLAIDCPRIVAVFDRQRAVESLQKRLTRPDRYWAAAALVQLGDARGIPALIDELEGTNGSAGSLAFRDLQHYTQEDIPYEANASVEARKAAAGEWRRWWRSTGTSFAVKTRAARIDIDGCRM